MTEPLTDPAVDVAGLPGFMLNVVRLLSSELVAISTGDEFKAAVLLWCRSWQQTPACSLPDDDRVLASFAGLGADVKKWRKVRDVALRGFVRCADGRLYHPVLVEDAKRASKARQQRRDAIDRRWGNAPTEVPRPAEGEARADRIRRARSIGRHTDEEWAALLTVFGNRCVRCGASGAVAEICKDHIVAVSRAGSDHIDNIQPMCTPCNSSKGVNDTDYRSAARKGWYEAFTAELKKSYGRKTPVLPVQRRDATRRAETNVRGWESAPPLATPPPPVAAPVVVTPPQEARGSRLPSDWTLPEDWREWATTELLPLGGGLPAIIGYVERAAERFRDHWLGKAGKDGAKRDWLATWRNWVREDIDRGKAPKGTANGKTDAAGSGSSPDYVARVVERQRARFGSGGQGSPGADAAAVLPAASGG